MSKPIKIVRMNAPKIEFNETAENFVNLILIHEYKAAQEIWTDFDIHFEILLDDGTVGSEFFVKVNEVLKECSPDLLSRYILSQNVREIISDPKKDY